MLCYNKVINEITDNLQSRCKAIENEITQKIKYSLLQIEPHTFLQRIRNLKIPIFQYQTQQDKAKKVGKKMQI